MSNETTTPNTEVSAPSQEVQKTRLQVLKERATQMGIAYSPNISEDTLAQRIKDHLSDKPAVAAETASAELSGAELTAKLHQEQTAELMALVRVRVVCNNPLKHNVPGEYFTFVNGILGKVTKYIPFGEATDPGYHIPRCLYNVLVEKQYMQLREVKQNGVTTSQSRLVPEFSVTVLPMLTEEEMEELKTRQHASNF